MRQVRESLILCEGYHDRAFWKGLLEHLGCTIPHDPQKTASRLIVKDPFGSKVTGGEYGYASRAGDFIRIRPCHGNAEVDDALRTRLKERTTRALRRLVVTYDADSDARADPAAKQGVESAHKSVQNVLKSFDPNFTTTPEGDYLLDSGNTVVSVAVWWTPDVDGPGLPWQHTLERLACAALSAAFPGRAQAVEQWLQSRPTVPPPPAAGPKEYAASNMAGWYADQGSEAFYAALWGTPKVASELQSRLDQIGVWRIAEALVT
jgi:hypothetical protein